jgi:hypothetical protein
MIPWIIVGYFTRNTLYERKAKTLITTLNLNKVLYYIEAIDNLGSWYKNTNYKPTFLKRMLIEFKGLNIVYVDVDARFLQYPKLFDELDCDIAVHEFDRTNWPRGRGTEVLSGTIFLRNNDRVFNLLEKWEEQCRENPTRWDQKSLEKILNNNFYRLPAEYCKINGLMKKVTEPVIVHYQASRMVRKNKWRLS